MLGPSFIDELIAAGLAGAPISWDADGIINESELTEEQQAALAAVVAAHNPSKPSYEALREQARAALDVSDKTVYRCFEAGVVLPAEWVTYRKALRAIVSASPSTATALPTMPAYPSGT